MKGAHVCLAVPLSKNFSGFLGTGRKSELKMKVSLYVKIGLVLMVFMLAPLSVGAFPSNKAAQGQSAQQVNAPIHGKIVETTFKQGGSGAVRTAGERTHSRKNSGNHG